MIEELEKFAKRVDILCENRTAFSPFIGKNGNYHLLAVLQPQMQIGNGNPFDVFKTEEGPLVSVGTLTGDRSVTIVNPDKTKDFVEVKTLFRNGEAAAKFIEKGKTMEVNILTRQTTSFFEGGKIAFKNLIVSTQEAKEIADEAKEVKAKKRR